MPGDFMQLNAVLSHTLLESFLPGSELSVPGVPGETSALNKDGYKIFDAMTGIVILFKHSHSFLENDPLTELLGIMRTPGGRRVPEELRRAILARVQCGEGNARVSLTYVR